MRTIIPALAVFAVWAYASAAEYRIEWENFPAAEGVAAARWESASGENYLKMSKKGAESVGKFSLPESGNYYVWVRDFTLCGNFRTATLFFNGRKIGKFGDRKPSDGKPGVWQWTRSPGETNLDAGIVEVKIVSDSDYTRFDAMILSTDPEFKPADDLKSIAKLEILK
ncbi:MAG: hypothetical protein MJ016_07065 [Victivallaceae bacterium]|nr:hypothetical protein [Victivallaceae bacterium]